MMAWPRRAGREHPPSAIWGNPSAGVEAPGLMADASGENVVLVDHSEYAQAAWNGTAFVFEPGVSHKQVLVPAISEALAAHPSE